MSDTSIESFTGKVRHYDRYDYIIGPLGPFTVRIWHDEVPDQTARVSEAERQMRAHADALSRLPQ